MKIKFNKELLLSLKDNYSKSEEIKKIIDDLVKKQQEDYLKNPTFTFVNQKDQRSGHLYITAKSSFLVGFDEMKSFRVCVGRFDKFEGGFKNPKVLEIARTKLIKRLKSVI